MISVISCVLKRQGGWLYGNQLNIFLICNFRNFMLIIAYITLKTCIFKLTNFLKFDFYSKDLKENLIDNLENYL